MAPMSGRVTVILWRLKSTSEKAKCSAFIKVSIETYQALENMVFN